MRIYGLLRGIKIGGQQVKKGLEGLIEDRKGPRKGPLAMMEAEGATEECNIEL